MKYFDTSVEEQETTINICYEDETVQIYSNRVDVIKNLTHNIGKPTKRDKRGKTYWLGATWEIPFSEVTTIKNILNKEIFIDKNFKAKKKETENKDGFEQIIINI